MGRGGTSKEKGCVESETAKKEILWRRGEGAKWVFLPEKKMREGKKGRKEMIRGRLREHLGAPAPEGKLEGEPLKGIKEKRSCTEKREAWRDIQKKEQSEKKEEFQWNAGRNLKVRKGGRKGLASHRKKQYFYGDIGRRGFAGKKGC